MKKNRRVFYAIAGVSLLVSIIPIVFYAASFPYGLSNNDQSWANFGSFFGGTVTSVFSFISFVLILYTFLKTTEDKENDDKVSMFFRYVEMLSFCKENVSVNFGNKSRKGQEVFSDFSGIVASMSFPQVQTIALKSNRSQEDEAIFQKHYTDYLFYRNSIRQFTNLLSIAFKFVESEGGEKKDMFFDVLVSQLSEQEVMAFGIINHKTISQELRDKVFINPSHFNAIKNMAEKSETILERRM